MTVASPDPSEPQTPSGASHNDPDLPTVLRKRDDSSVKKAVVGVLSGLVAFLVVRAYPALGFFFVLMLLCWVAGSLLGKKVLQSRPSFRSALAWAGLIAWLLPFVGVLVSGAVWSGQGLGRPVARERVLTVICLALSLINGAAGTLGFRP